MASPGQEDPPEEWAQGEQTYEGYDYEAPVEDGQEYYAGGGDYYEGGYEDPSSSMGIPTPAPLPPTHPTPAPPPPFPMAPQSSLTFSTTPGEVDFFDSSTSGSTFAPSFHPEPPVPMGLPPPTGYEHRVEVSRGPIMAQPSGEASSEQVGSTKAFWTLKFWQQYFDVDTADVVGRLRDVATPFSPPDYLAHKRYAYRAVGEVSGPEKGPDLYGPVWVCVTLWMLMSVTAQLRRLAQNAPEGDWWPPVLFSCGLLFGYQVFVPTALWVAMKWKDVPLGLVDIHCLYGYSLVAYLVTSWVFVFRLEWLHWAALGIASTFSTGYVVLNLWGLWRAFLDERWFLCTVLGCTVLHVSLICSFKFRLFTGDYAIPAAK